MQEMFASSNIEGKKVLDLACGDGYYSRYAKDIGANTVVGVDISSGIFYYFILYKLFIEIFIFSHDRFSKITRL